MFVEIFKAALTLFIIIDPFVSLSMFLTLTSGRDKSYVTRQASTAVYVAGMMLALFLFLGEIILDLLHISFSSFQIGGGIILLLLGIRTVMGVNFQNPYKYKTSIVIIGTPMMSGPGAMTTLVILASTYGTLVAGIATLLVLIAAWVILLYAYHIQRFVGYRVIEVFSRIMGLLLTAIAIEYIASGIHGLV